jgi:hypothetical protein
MPQDRLGQGASGCLKPALLHFFGLIFTCYVWFLFLGRKGILLGIGAYIAILSGRLFLRIFGRAR